MSGDVCLVGGMSGDGVWWEGCQVMVSGGRDVGDVCLVGGMSGDVCLVGGDVR